MAEPDKPSGAAGAAGATTAPKPNVASQGNPAFRMLGLPRIRAKLPSRNWSIFWGVVFSFSAAVIYDRREKRRIQQRWCDAVSHLSREPLEPSGLPRKLTVFLAAPPGDGLRPSRDYFQEYVRPILVAAAIDWDVVEGRKEGDVRARLAERIRQERRRNGEGGGPLDDEADVVHEIRARNGIHEVDDRAGDLVIGRHTWKEYMRGLHEGYLGPVRDPKEETEGKAEEAPSLHQMQPQNTTSGPVADLESITGPSTPSDAASSTDDASPTAGTPTDNDGDEKKSSEKEQASTKPDEPPKKPIPTPAYLSTASYPTASLASSSPSIFAPAVFLDQPHLLGIMNTPLRTARFLNRRALAERTGAEVASMILTSEMRPFAGPEDGGSSGLEPDDAAFSSPSQDPSSTPEASSGPGQTWEQAAVGAHAERDWHKTARAPRPDGVEAVWMDPIVVDARIGRRMRVPARDAPPAPAAAAAAAAAAAEEGAVMDVKEEQKQVKGRARDWTGGVDTEKARSWGQWFVYVTGFEDERKPRGLGAKDGLVGGEDD